MEAWMNCKKAEEEMNEDERDEEFYETIEAPKFVDLTKPNLFSLHDDRYWFCLRVGCDKKHEDEINPDEISKNFVLRVMAARSPNVKLRRALDRTYSSINNKKCPLSAPPKPSKPRVPRLGMGSTSISRKMVLEPREEFRPPSKVASSTPMARVKQVAAKYMTTPRNRKCLPNSNSFRSVQNLKPISDDVPKNRMVAKALVFRSPTKPFSVKRSVELHIPLKRICEGMKKLEITNQKKLTRTTDRSKAASRLCEDERGKDKLPPQNSKSIKIDKKQNSTMHCHSLLEKVGENDDSADMEMDLRSKYDLLIDTSRFNEGDECKMHLPTLGEHFSRVHQPFEGAVDGSGQIDTADKENALSSNENREHNCNHNNQSGKEKAILGKQLIKQNNKVVQKIDKNLQCGVIATSACPVLVKYEKPKPTSVKPFRLRTDERGILKEAAQREAASFPVVSLKRAHGISIQNNDVTSVEQSKRNNYISLVCRKESEGTHQINKVGKAVDQKISRQKTVDQKISRQKTGQKLAISHRRSESTNRESNLVNSSLGIRRMEESLMTRSFCPQQQHRPQRLASTKKAAASYLGPGQQLCVIKECSSKLTKPKEQLDFSGVIAENRSTSQGKRSVTVPKGPSFHSSHPPKNCTTEKCSD